MTFLKQRAVVIALCLVVTALAGVVYGQAFGVQPVTPTVVSGPDVGFRIEGMRGGTPVGRLVVRMNGRWVEADFQMISKPLSESR